MRVAIRPAARRTSRRGARSVIGPLLTVGNASCTSNYPAGPAVPGADGVPGSRLDHIPARNRVAFAGRNARRAGCPHHRGDGTRGLNTMSRHLQITHLEEHPNLEEILGVLAQLAHVGDDHLVALARSWRNTVHVAEARRRALSPDAPLVVEVLAAFDALSALFADDLAGGPDYVRIRPEVTTTALKAVR